LKDELDNFLAGIKRENILLKAEVIDFKSKILSENILYFSPIKYLKLPKPNITKTIKKILNGFIIKLSTDKLAKNLYLRADEIEGKFSDNYFDLLPDEKVSINLKTNISEEKLIEVLTIRTLDDAF